MNPHNPIDHVVIIVRFVEKSFGLSVLNARVTVSDDMSDCFDFTQTPLGPPV
jgi:phospholipase C